MQPASLPIMLPAALLVPQQLLQQTTGKQACGKQPAALAWTCSRRRFGNTTARMVPSDESLACWRQLASLSWL
jgi:hypothetical protein